MESMINTFIRASAFVILIGSLSSCAVFDYFFPDKSNEYQKAEVYQDLTLPEGISAPAIRQSMPIPEVAEELKAIPLPEEVSPPPPLDIEMLKSGVQIRNTGNKTWLFIDKPAAQVWPELLAFLKVNDFAIAKSEPVRGLIDTQWIIFDSIEAEQGLLVKVKQGRNNKQDYSFRYRIVLQPGVQRNTSRLLLIVQSAANQRSELNPWPKKSVDTGIEVVLLEDIITALVNGFEKKTSVSLLAQKLERKFELDIVKSDQNTVLRINQDFNHSWHLVSKSIKRAGLPLSDLNRSAGIFYLRADKTSKKAQKFQEKAVALGEKLNKEGATYLLKLKEDSEGVVVSLFSEDEINVSDKLSEFVLNKVKENIK